MTAPRTDPQSIVPVEPPEPIVPEALFDEGPDAVRNFRAGWRAARASQPITATTLLPDDDEPYRDRPDEDLTIGEVNARAGWRMAREQVRRRLAALPVREDEPTGIDVERLVETTRALVNALDYVPGSQIGGLIALVIAALPREASHVR